MNKLNKLMKYDLRAGFKKNIISILVFFVLCAGISGIGAYSIKDCEELYGVKATIMDYICFLTGGPKHIPDGMLRIYTIPVLWLIIPVMVSYITGYYAMTDLHAYGQQILIRSGSRNKWWISKCIWNGLTVIALYAVLYVCAILTAVINGAENGIRLTPEIAMDICSIDVVEQNNAVMTVILCVMPAIVSLAICMVQMVIALIFSPVIGFVVAQSVVFLSTIFEYKFLISNYAMLSHNKITCGSDIVWNEGIIICVMVYVAAFIIGIVYFGRCNILPKSQEV